ncbi:MAG TPA: TIGR02186 family protein [Rhizomicrobium sp.]|nr:TIGR02186 family protein [Rhizomicrobium sp.]
MRWLAFALLLATPAAASEDLVSGLSQDTIEIRSNYNGTDIVVFGAIERPVSEARPDIVVVVRGPETDIRVRRKDRAMGVWINKNRVILHGMPGYYFAAGNRPIAQTANAATLSQYGLGLAALKPRAVTGRHALKPFLDALIRTETRNRLYVEAPDGVEFLSGTLFRVRVPLPSSAPRGHYVAEVYLLRGGRVIDTRASDLVIDQTGLERRIFDFSQGEPLAYGLSVVLTAMAMGWLSSLAFRRA